MRLIDVDALIDKLAKVVPYTIINEIDSAYAQGLNRAYQEIIEAPIIIEFNGDITEVIVKGEKYSKESPNLGMKARAEEILEIIKNRKE